MYWKYTTRTNKFMKYRIMANIASKIEKRECCAFSVNRKLFMDIMLGRNLHATVIKASRSVKHH